MVLVFFEESRRHAGHTKGAFGLEYTTGAIVQRLIAGGNSLAAVVAVEHLDRGDPDIVGRRVFDNDLMLRRKIPAREGPADRLLQHLVQRQATAAGVATQLRNEDVAGMPGTVGGRPPIGQYTADTIGGGHIGRP